MPTLGTGRCGGRGHRPLQGSRRRRLVAVDNPIAAAPTSNTATVIAGTTGRRPPQLAGTWAPSAWASWSKLQRRAGRCVARGPAISPGSGQAQSGLQDRRRRIGRRRRHRRGDRGRVRWCRRVCVPPNAPRKRPSVRTGVHQQVRFGVVVTAGMLPPPTRNDRFTSSAVQEFAAGRVCSRPCPRCPTSHGLCPRARCGSAEDIAQRVGQRGHRVTNAVRLALRHSIRSLASDRSPRCRLDRTRRAR